MLNIIPPSQFKSIPWKNGKGTTTELAVSAGGSMQDFDWRISMADVADTPMARAVKADEKLLAYATRGWDRWYPDMKPAALA